jgi:branched-chain amino acid transport system substrate-binding protein
MPLGSPFRPRAAVAGLALLGGLSLAAPAATRAADPIQIPVVLALTGSASFLGKAEGTSLQIVEADVNAHGGVKGRPIHFAIADDQSTPANAVQLLNAALAQKPPVVMGSAVVALCNAMSAIVKTNGPVHYCFSPGVHPAPGAWTFSSSLSTDDLAAISLRYFKGRGWTRLAMISSTDASGQDAERAFVEAQKRPENRAGPQIVMLQHFNTTDVSVSAQMAAMKAINPDVVIAWSTGTPFGTLLRGISDVGITTPIMTGNGNITTAEMTQYKALLPKQLYVAGPRFLAREGVRPGPIRDAQDRFYNAFKRAGITPDIAYSFSWDPALIVVDALRHAGADATPDHIKAYIENLHGFAGINGLYDFRDGSQRGLQEGTAVIIRWDPDKTNWTGVSKPGGDPLP